MRRIVLAFTLLLLLAATPVSAHRSGCHRWHSCPSDTGSYICGDLGYTSGCGNAPVQAQVVIPPTTVVQHEIPTSIPTRVPIRTSTPTMTPTLTLTIEPTSAPSLTPTPQSKGISSRA